MRKFMTGTAIALMFAAAPALADSASTSASGEVITSPTSDDRAVSEPAVKAGGDSSTTVDVGTEATGASSMTTTNAQGEPMSTTGKASGTADGTVIEEGKPATSAGSEVITDVEGDPVSADDS